MSDEIRTKRPQHGPGRGPGAGMGAGEKAKDFKKSFASLIEYSRRDIPAGVIALVLAVTATIFSIVGPNKLKDLTNLITDGFVNGIDMDEVKDIAFLLVVLDSLGFIFIYILFYTQTK